MGNCGLSPAPLGSRSTNPFAAAFRSLTTHGPQWSTAGEFFEITDARGYFTNMAPLVGHNAIRDAVMGDASRPCTADELERMRHCLAEALDAGVFGLSTGLLYTPGLYAEAREIEELVAVLPDHAVYATHMRDEGAGLLASLHETIAVAAATGRKVHVSHLKAAGRAQWGLMPEALTLLDSARDRGMRLTQDVYPYTASSTALQAALPPSFQQGGPTRILERLTRPGAADDLTSAFANGAWEGIIQLAGWDGVVVASTRSGAHVGQTLDQITAGGPTSHVAALVELLVAEHLEVTVVIHAMHDDDLRAALAHPLTMVGTDGTPPGGVGRPHPRAYGSFPRALRRYALTAGGIDLPELVRRMTSLPADTFGLADRGRLVPGAAADIVVFSTETVADEATYEDPTLPPSGIELVMVNGRPAVADGRCGEGRHGKRLRPATA